MIQPFERVARLIVLALVTAGLPGLAGSALGQLQTVATGDFNSDGRADLAIGVPYEDLADISDAGAVHVLYSAGNGLTANGDQFWHQDRPGVSDQAESGDRFGSVVASGDFDGDGFDDLAIAATGENVGAIEAAGVVHVLYGAAGGLKASGSQILHQNTPGIIDNAEDFDTFGFCLAAGDFDNDGFADLAISAAVEALGTTTNAGAVHVLYGTSAGLATSNDEFWHQDSVGVIDAADENDFFGSSLAAGDFDGDGFDDLAIGVPGENIGAVLGAGAVHILYGGLGGLSSAGDQLWHQDSPDVNDTAEESDVFGALLAAADFDNDGFDDLAIAARFEDIDLVEDAGAVHVLFGGSSGLSAAGNEFWHQDSPGIEGTADAFDSFGYSLAAGNFDGDDFADLAIGVPFGSAGGMASAGGVAVLYGAGGGLIAAGNQLWQQDSPGVPGGPQEDDRFGLAIVAGDFNNDGRDDLAIAVPGEDVSAVSDAGAVYTMKGAAGSGLSATGDKLWHQNVSGINDNAEPDDAFSGE